MWQSATWAPDHSSAVSVVPMPSVEGSARLISCSVGVGRGHRVGQGPEHLAALVQVLPVERGQRGDRDGAGDLACGMPAHAVGDGQEIRPRVRGVLVALAEQSDVRAERIVQCESHLRSSRTVLPIRIGTPTGTGVGWVTFCRSR